MIKKVLQNQKVISFLLTVLFFVLPFERIPTFEVSGFTVKISYVVSILVLFFAAQIIIKNKIKLENDEKALAVFWLLAFISTLLLGTLKERGFVILLMWAFMFVLYFLLSRIIPKVNGSKLVEILIWGALVASLFGLFQFIGDFLGLSEKVTLLSIPYTKTVLGFPRVQSVALEPLYFANFLLVPIFILFDRYLRQGTAINRYWAISLCVLTAFILTVSRGAYLGIIIALLLYFVYLGINKNYIAIFKIFIVIVASIFISYIMINLNSGKETNQKVVSHSFDYFQGANNDGSAMDRVKVYNLALNQFVKNPILGNGLASFGNVATSNEQKMIGKYQTVNNQYLEILTENGLFGLIAFIAFLIFYFKNVIEKIKSVSNGDRDYLFSVGLGLVAIFIQYNFFSTLYIIYVWVFLALLKSHTIDQEDEKIIK